MIPLSKPYFTEEELIVVREVLNSGWVAGQGPKNKELSELICQYTNTRYAIPVNNCTAGLHLSLLALGVGNGDEVLVSDFTFPATGHSVMYCGAIPRFVDVKLDTYNIDPTKIEEKINNKTKGIIVVHALGQMAEMDSIMEIAKKHRLFVIEDAACALGAEYKGKKAGQYGDITVFSFHARKNVTCGEGGIIVTDNKEYADFMASLSCFGMQSAYSRQSEFSIPSFTFLGYNYKLSDINAAIAIVQLRKYEEMLEKRSSLVKMYLDELKDFTYLKPPSVSQDAKHIYQTFAVLLEEKINRNQLILDMKADDIQTQIGTYCSFIQKVYKNELDICPNSKYLYDHTLAIPLFFELSEIELLKVVEVLKKNINKQLN